MPLRDTLAPTLFTSLFFYENLISCTGIESYENIRSLRLMKVTRKKADVRFQIELCLEISSQVDKKVYQLENKENVVFWVLFCLFYDRCRDLIEFQYKKLD